MCRVLRFYLALLLGTLLNGTWLSQWAAYTWSTTEDANSEVSQSLIATATRLQNHVFYVVCVLNTNPIEGVIIIKMKVSCRACYEHLTNFQICEKVMSNRCNSSQQENKQRTHKEEELDDNGAGLGTRPRKLLVWLGQHMGMCATLAHFYCLSIQLVSSKQKCQLP